MARRRRTWGSLVFESDCVEQALAPGQYWRNPRVSICRQVHTSDTLLFRAAIRPAVCDGTVKYSFCRCCRGCFVNGRPLSDCFNYFVRCPSDRDIDPVVSCNLLQVVCHKGRHTTGINGPQQVAGSRGDSGISNTRGNRDRRLGRPPGSVAFAECTGKKCHPPGKLIVCFHERLVAPVEPAAPLYIAGGRQRRSKVDHKFSAMRVAARRSLPDVGEVRHPTNTRPTPTNRGRIAALDAPARRA